MMSLQQLQHTYPWRNLQSIQIARDTTFSVWLVNFHDLLKKHGDDILVNSFQTREVFHAAVGLVDCCLPDMETDLIYTKLADKKTYTLLIFRDRSEAEAEMSKRLQARWKKREKERSEGTAAETAAKAKPPRQSSPKKEEESEEETADDLLRSGRLDVGDKQDRFEGAEEDDNHFHLVFTDTEEEQEQESSEEEEDKEEPLSKGYKKFIKNCLLRKKRQAAALEGEKPIGLGPRDIASPDLLVGVAAFQERMANRDLQKFIHLIFLSVRRRQRKAGLGKHMVALLKDELVVGTYKAVVVHADHSAVGFFRKYGFVSDVHLNKQWEEIADDFTNCVIMSYLPPFGKRYDDLLSKNRVGLCQVAMNDELQKWAKKAEEAYVEQLSLVLRFNQEVERLRGVVTSQDDLIKHLMSEVRNLNRQNIEEMSTTLQEIDEDGKPVLAGAGDRGSHSEELNVRVQTLIKARDRVKRVMNERSVLTGGLLPGTQPRHVFSVTHVVPTTLPLTPPSTLEYLRRVSPNVADAPVPLFYCGGREKNSTILSILHEGFRPGDAKQGEFGRGFYFAKDPRLAAVYSSSGRLLVANVYLGNVMEVELSARARSLRPQPQFQSILCPGRLRLEPECGLDLGEYVIFDARQAVPLGLIEYEEEGSEDEEVQK